MDCGFLKMLSEIIVMVICAQMLMVLLGNGSFSKYLRMFVEMLVLWKFISVISYVISAVEQSLNALEQVL